jgi:4,5-DOPA dioxygenase extradiol
MDRVGLPTPAEIDTGWSAKELNAMSTLPALFVSHGAPTLIITPGEARDFLSALGAQLPRPRAVLAVSAHWETVEPTVSLAPHPETIHDFSGFPRELYEMRYPAPGAVELAKRTSALLTQAGLAARADDRRGLDHGAWVPLKLIYPDADIPVTQLSVQSKLDARHQSTPAWVSDFSDWVSDASNSSDLDTLLRYREQAPAAARNHPTEEHFLPFFVALGAGSASTQASRIHQSTTFGVLAMDAYRFD